MANGAEVTTVKDSTVTAAPVTATDSTASPAKKPLSKAAARREKRKRVLDLSTGRRYTAYAWSAQKKWAVILVLCLVQISMNWNAAIYANAIEGISKEFHVDIKTAALGQMVFLVTYAFGCELWAPFSEEFGRKWILQLSLFLVNIWQIPSAIAPNMTTMIVARALGGICSGGGSVTLGIVADMFESAWQSYAVCTVVLASTSGSVIAPIFGGIIETKLPWQWVFWISAILGGATQFLHLFVPETRPEVLLAREAARRREETGADIWGEIEKKGTFRERLQQEPQDLFRDIWELMWRPYLFLATEPIIASLSLLSGFADTLIFIGLSSYPRVMHNWHFGKVSIGLCFSALLVAYIVAFFVFLWQYRKDRQIMQGNPDALRPEHRLMMLLWFAPMLPVGMFAYGLVSVGPARNLHWFAPIFFSWVVGLSNFAVYMATIDYMVASYGKYAASATGGNGFCRDLLAGTAALFAGPMYDNTAKHAGEWQYMWPTEILALIALLLVIPVYLLYFKYGEILRRKSFYAGQVEAARLQAQQTTNGVVEQIPQAEGAVENIELPSRGTQASSEESTVGGSYDVVYHEDARE